MRNKLSVKELNNILVTNLQDWKKDLDINSVLKLNEELSEDDISIICSPAFYDELHSNDDLFNVLDNNFLSTDLCVYSPKTFIAIHNIYNV